jgi:hypothetical protein
MPGFVEPCDPTLQERAPTGDGWIYEIKTDGYRAQVHIRNGRVTIYSRSGYDWSVQFSSIAKAASKLKVRDAIIDGEATVLGNTGLPDFQALRRELGNRESPNLLLHAFDLLYLNGRDLRRTPLLERKQALKGVLQGTAPTLLYVDFLQEDGTRVFKHACRMGLRVSSQNGLTRRTVRGARTVGSSLSAPRATRFRSLRSSRSLERAHARSPHFTWGVGTEIGLFTLAKLAAATPRPSPENCASALTR